MSTAPKRLIRIFLTLNLCAACGSGVLNNPRADAAGASDGGTPDSGEPPTWTPYKILDFNDGVLGAGPTNGADGFNGEGYDNIYSDAESFEGGQACRMRAAPDSATFDFGGLIDYSPTLGAGDELWWRVRLFFPAGFDYDANPRLKFMRMYRSSGGYLDWYILPSFFATAFSYDPEMDNPFSLPFGSAADKPVLGVWETYEGYAKLDAVPAASGGTAMARFWKNGELLYESGERATLSDAADRPASGLLFTYWNFGNGPRLPPVEEYWYVDDILIATSASPPTTVDAAGNRMIGVAATASDFD